MFWTSFLMVLVYTWPSDGTMTHYLGGAFSVIPEVAMGTESNSKIIQKMVRKNNTKNTKIIQKQLKHNSNIY